MKFKLFSVLLSFSLSGVLFASDLSQANFSPVMKKNKVYAYEISKIEAYSYFEKIGFNDGDQILSIDGIKLNSKTTGSAAVIKLIQKKAKKASVLRRDRKILITINNN